MSVRSFAVIIVLALTGCRPAAPVVTPAVGSLVQASVDNLLRKINARLAVMESVAAFKHAQGKPIDDPEREAAMLDQLETQAAAHRLSRNDVRSFFSAQIEAAKAVQQNLFNDWDRGRREPVRATVGLPEIRQRIDAINSELLLALAEYRQLHVAIEHDALRQQATALVHGAGIDDRARELAIEPLIRR